MLLIIICADVQFHSRRIAQIFTVTSGSDRARAMSYLQFRAPHIRGPIEFNLSTFFNQGPGFFASYGGQPGVVMQRSEMYDRGRDER